MDATQVQPLRLSLEDRINGVMHDSEDILYKLTKLQTPKGREIEIVTELPARLDPDIVISYVQRWREIQQHFDCDLRVYAWTYDTTVEKYVLSAVQAMSHIMVTTLPIYLKGDSPYAY